MTDREAKVSFFGGGLGLTGSLVAIAAEVFGFGGIAAALTANAPESVGCFEPDTSSGGTDGCFAAVLSVFWVWNGISNASSSARFSGVSESSAASPAPSSRSAVSS